MSRERVAAPGQSHQRRVIGAPRSPGDQHGSVQPRSFWLEPQGGGLVVAPGWSGVGRKSALPSSGLPCDVRS
eukprot:12360353-Alexandrium_andersonii.AAC.1